MASKKVKGQKLNFSEFVSSTGGANLADELPSGSSGLPMEDRPRNAGRWDKQRADSEGGAGGYGSRGGGGGRRYGGEGGGDENEYGDGADEDAPSRADESNAWRRPGEAGGGGGGGGDARRGGGGAGGGYRDRDREGGRGGLGDRSGRSGFGGGRGGDGGDGAGGGEGGDRDMGDFRRRQDDSGDRDRQAQQDDNERGGGGRSDSADDWRSSRAGMGGGAGGRGRDDGSNQARRGDADAEWRKFPVRDRGGEDREGRSYGGGGRGFGGDRRSDEHGSSSERRGGYGGSRYGRDEGGEERSDDRERGRGGFDRDRDGGRGGDRYEQGGGRGGGYERSEGGRGGGDRYDGSGRSSVGRRGDVGRDEQQQQQQPERPAHLRNLLKKAADEEESSLPEEAEGKKESALERMERETAEREKAASEMSTARSSRPAAGGAAVPSSDEPKRSYGLSRLAERAALASSAAPASEEREAANKPPELAPLRMSALRKTPSTASSTAPSASSSSSGPLPGQSAGRSKKETDAVVEASSVPSPAIIDDSRYSDELKKPLTQAKKSSPLEKAIADRDSITDKQLAEAMAKLDLQQADSNRRRDVAGVIVRSLIEDKMKLDAAVKALAGKDDGDTLAEALKLYRDRKGESELSQLVQASGVNIVSALLPNTANPSTADVDAFLGRHSLMVLRPVPDLTADMSGLLASSPSPQAILDHINGAVPQSTPVPAPLTKQLYASLFEPLFAASPPSTALLSSYVPLLRRLSVTSPIALLYAAQVAWFNKGAAKAALKDVFAALLSEKVVTGADVVGWRDDLREGKGLPGKPKALLQVSAWVKGVEEEEKKRRPKEEEEDEDEDDEEDDEDEDDY